MAKIISILKIMVSFAGFIVLIMTFFNLRENDLAEKIAAMFIISLVCGIYLYYLIVTGIWNFNGKQYRPNILLLLGILMHFILIFCLLYFGYTSFPREVFLTGIFCSVFGLAIGIFDINQLLIGWKNRKSVFG